MNPALPSFPSSALLCSALLVRKFGIDAHITRSPLAGQTDSHSQRVSAVLEVADSFLCNCCSATRLTQFNSRCWKNRNLKVKERETSPSSHNTLRIMANLAQPPILEPSGERVEVPVAKPSELKKEAQEHRTDPNVVAEANRETEHQYVFSEKKLDGVEGKEDSLPKDGVQKDIQI